jgi:hypothetical protein
VKTYDAASPVHCRLTLVSNDSPPPILAATSVGAGIIRALLNSGHRVEPGALPDVRKGRGGSEGRDEGRAVQVDPRLTPG